MISPGQKQVALTALDELRWANGARQYVLEKLNQVGSGQLTPAADDLVYHYTDANALQAILQYGALRASSMAFLNDKTEYKLGISKFCEAINTSGEPTIVTIRDAVLAVLEDEHHQLKQRLEVYNCSFSHDGDLLSQWRGYADAGSGFSIGFNAVEVSQLLWPRGWSYNVVYKGVEQLNTAKVVVDAFGEYFTAQGGVQSISAVDFSISLALGTVAALAPAMKHCGFSEEREFRHVVNNQYGQLTKLGENGQRESLVKWRARNGDIIPFVELDAVEDVPVLPPGGAGIATIEQRRTKLPVKVIYVGPCHDFDRTEQSLHALLRQYEYENVDVRRACIPFLP